MPKQRLINCDFFATSGFTKNLSNKAKLLYFFFLTNADDKGFVGNGVDIADTLDFCEEHFENVLFQFKYVDALKELEEKRLVFKFVDRVGNIVYLIRHWFLHNKNQKYLSTNYLSYLAQVELINNEYYLKSEKEKPLKEKENKENKEIKLKEENQEWEKDWDRLVNEMKDNEKKGEENE